ncbi:MAG: ABC-2 family transporter protein [Nanoarchaeota archaeon]|nr:ABC-2 family transporter protein [Nanoarchaeota archaeon]
MRLLKLYLEYAKVHMKEILEYRLDAVIGFIAIAFTNLASLIFFWVIFANIPSLNGWTLGQVLFIFGTISTAFGISHAFVPGVSVWWVEDLVQNGGLDRMLLKPISILQHLLIYGGIDTDGFGDLVVGIAVLTVASNMIGISWTIFSLGLYAILLVSAALILISMHIIMSTLCFWVVKAHPVADIFFALTKFTEYPIDIFSPVTVFFISLIVPVAFIGYYPAQIFIGQGLWLNAAYLTPVVAIILFFIASRVWNFGLKNYTSTGS